MAIVVDDPASVAITPQRGRRLLPILRELPAVPLLLLALLFFAAIMAPVLAPHSRLEPVTPTAAQCLARYGMEACPYLDDVPPFWMAGGSIATPLGTDFLGRDVLSRLMYGAQISLL